jgi:hypothetical protein
MLIVSFELGSHRIVTDQRAAVDAPDLEYL